MGANGRWGGREAAGLACLAAFACASAGQGLRLAASGAEPAAWVRIDIVWQCWSLCALAWIAARGRIDLAGWGFCALLAIPLGMFDPLAHWLHPALSKLSLYPPFWGRGNDPEQSPQYARLLVWALALGVAWARVARARRLGRDPFVSISLLGASSVLATSLIFHAAAVWIAQDRQEEMLADARAAMASSREAAFLGYCEARQALCAQGGRVDYAISQMPEASREQARLSLGAVAGSGPGAFAHWRQSADPKSFNRLPSLLAAASIGPGGEARLWVDQRALPRALALGERVFAWLALWAHGFWLWGSIFLGAWHARRATKRATSSGSEPAGA